MLTDPPTLASTRLLLLQLLVLASLALIAAPPSARLAVTRVGKRGRFGSPPLFLCRRWPHRRTCQAATRGFISRSSNTDPGDSDEGRRRGGGEGGRHHPSGREEREGVQPHSSCHRMAPPQAVTLEPPNPTTHHPCPKTCHPRPQTRHVSHLDDLGHRPRCWVKFPPMKMTRKSAQAVSILDTLYVLGGYDFDVLQVFSL